MPFTEVMHKWKHGLLHSGSKHGPKVGSQKQAIAIMLSEKRKAKSGKKEYQSHGVGPSGRAAEDMISSSSKKRKR